MAKNKYPSRLFIGLALFVVYLFVAARPIPPETVLVPHWLSSLESEYPVTFEHGAVSAAVRGRSAEPSSPVEPSSLQEPLSPAEPSSLQEPLSPVGPLSPAEPLSPTERIPFRLGQRFGYVDAGGVFSIKRESAGEIEINRDFWAVYGGDDDAIEVRDPEDQPVFTISGDRGYPLFMDGRFFLVGDELNYLTALDASGAAEWTYDFAAPITGIDAAAGLVLAGFLDGTVELLDGQGKRVFSFKPGGSRLAVICACRISQDGSYLAVISGYDDQRFLLLGRSGDSWKVLYHEFLSNGFRREVYLAFVDSGRRVAFEREGGLAIYDIAGRKAHRVELNGRVYAMESCGEQNLLFVITSRSETRKELVGIRFPGSIIMEAPFRSGAAFLERQGERLYVGGGNTIAAFTLERR